MVSYSNILHVNFHRKLGVKICRFRIPGLAGLLVVIVFSCFSVAVSAQTPTPRSDASIKLENDTKKNKKRIFDIGRGNEITIVRRGSKEFYGTITDIGDDSVAVSEVDLKVQVDIPYEQISKVEKGYGDGRGFSGKRISPHKHRIGLIIIGATAAAVAIFLISVLKNPNF